MVPQGSPVDKEFAVVVGRTLVVVELAAGLETFERCLEAASGPGAEHALGWAEWVGMALKSHG